jgi:hypothetical protein
MPDNGKKEKKFSDMSVEEMIAHLKKKVKAYTAPIKPRGTVTLGGGRGQLGRASKAQSRAHSGGGPNE